MGLVVLQIVRAYGAKEVLIVDPLRTRLRISEGLGATRAISIEELETGKANYLSEFHAVIDGVGLGQTVLLASELGDIGGIVVVYGVPQSGLTEIPLLDLFKKDMKLLTSRLYPRSFGKAMAVDLARFNIQVNAITPGFIKTQFNELLWGNKEKLNWATDRMGSRSNLFQTFRFTRGPNGYNSALE